MANISRHIYASKLVEMLTYVQTSDTANNNKLQVKRALTLDGHLYAELKMLLFPFPGQLVWLNEQGVLRGQKRRRDSSASSPSRTHLGGRQAFPCCTEHSFRSWVPHSFLPVPVLSPAVLKDCTAYTRPQTQWGILTNLPHVKSMKPSKMLVMT